jgi:hypothetical protein
VPHHPALERRQSVERHCEWYAQPAPFGSDPAGVQSVASPAYQAAQVCDAVARAQAAITVGLLPVPGAANSFGQNTESRDWHSSSETK